MVSARTVRKFLESESVVHDVVGRFCRKDGHRAVRGVEAKLHVHWLPRVGVLVLRDAVGVGAGVSEGRLVGLAGDCTAQIEQRQLDRPAYRGVGPPAGPEAVIAAVDVELLGDGAVDDEQRGVYASGAHDAPQVEPVVHHGLQRGDYHRHVLGQAAGHHGVDGDALHSRPAAEGRQFGDQLVAAASGLGDELAHQAVGRRHHGQPVGPPRLKHQLYGIGYFGGKHDP